MERKVLRSWIEKMNSFYFSFIFCTLSNNTPHNSVTKQMSNQFVWSVHARLWPNGNFPYHWNFFDVCACACVCACDYFISFEWNLNFWRRKISELFRMWMWMCWCCHVSLYVGEIYIYIANMTITQQIAKTKKPANHIDKADKFRRMTDKEFVSCAMYICNRNRVL